mgnify:FL=1
MKKSSKLLLVLSLLGLGSGVLASCETGANNAIPTGKVNEGAETNASYNIINASSEAAYLDGLPEKGVAHQSYSFRVSLKPGYHFNDKITITSGETTVSYTFKDSYYTFEMPEAEVAITVDVGKTDFTIKSTSYFVSNVYLDQEGEENVIARSALPGTALKFEAHADEDFEFTTITMNGKALKEGDDGFYHFSMPTRPAIISSDKVAVKYNVTMTSELALSTATIYTNTETKAAITQAVKDEKVYIAFTPKAEDASVKYEVSVKTLVDEGETSKELTVTKEEGAENTFSFSMVSKNVEISVKETDLSLYKKSALINKAWKGVDLSKEGEFGSKSYSELNTPLVSFAEDGTGSMKNYSSEEAITWEPTTTHGARVTNKKVVSEAIATEHILAMQYPLTYKAPSWEDTNYYIADDTYDLHYYTFNSVNHDRLVWVEDANHNIVENIFIHDNAYRTGVTIKKADGSLALGTDVTESSHFVIYEGETKLIDIAAGKIAVENTITVEPTQYVNCEVKNAAGEAITSSINGATITIHVSLAEGAPENLGIRKPVVKDSSDYNVQVVKVDDETYTFVMPEKAVTITNSTVDFSAYKGYAALGSYVSYNFYNNKSSDQDFSTNKPNIVRWDFNAAGEATKDSTKYTISSLENTPEGDMVLSNVTASGETQTTAIKYSNGLMVTPYSFGGTNWNDVFVGIRLPAGKVEEDVKVQAHYIVSSGSSSIWAVSFLVSNEVFGSIFCYKGEIFMGVTYTYEEGSTRIGEDSSYHVVKNGVTLFDVVNGTTTDKRVTE